MGVIDAAIELGQRGFRVHPLKAKDQPYTKYSQTATSDPDAIARLFQPFPHALIAIATGRGLVVIDDDRGLVGPDESLPLTLTATTPSRGHHYYFRCATSVRNSAGKIAPGIDVRGEGGYVVAPPSEGREWLFPEHVPLAPLPSLLLAACLREERAANREFEPRTHVPAGERHDYLVRFAGWALANELASDTAELTDVTTAHAWCVCEPWHSHELPGVSKHIADICRWVIGRENARA